MRTYKTTKRARCERWPYMPNQPQWAIVHPLFAVAAAVNPGAQTFIGAREEADGVHFRFQERGNPEVVVVVLPPARTVTPVTSYADTRGRLLSDLRGIRRMAMRARTMERTAQLVRHCWEKQFALLAARAEHFGYSYDIATAREGRS